MSWPCLTLISSYRLVRTNNAADALSQHPVEPNCKLESESDVDSEDPVVLLYATICDIIKPFVLKKEV